MEDSQPHKSMLPKAPIPVEESRAQRLQRSQARFRDRGGIFVPTARNTLVDILLGRKVASPKKGRGRSASLSPKKKSTKGGLRHNDEEVKVLRTSPRKAAQRQEPEAVQGPSSFGDMIMKHKKTKTSEKAKPATASSGAKNLVDTEKPLTKKRGRKPKAVVQEVEPPNTSVDPPPPAKSQSTLKKPRTKSASKKPASLAGSKKNSSIEGPSISGPNKSAKTTSKTELDPVMKKSSCTSTSTASKRKPPASIKAGPAPLQQSSTGIGSSKIKKAPVSHDDRRINEVHQESSREIAFTEKKGKKKAPETINPLDKPDVTAAAVEVLPKTRKKRARPAESECPSPQKRAKQTPSEETKSRPRRKKAPTAQKDTTMSMQETVETKNKDPLSKSPPSKKRARGPDDGRPGAKRKKTKGTMDITVPDETVKKQANGSKGKAEKTKKPPASKTSRTKAVTTKASKQDKAQAPAETDTESGALIIPRIRPRKSVIIRMKEPDPHQRVDNDPDPIDFLG